MANEIWITYQHVSDPRQEKEGLSIPVQQEISQDYIKEQSGVLFR
ncbi:MAG TPA: hypothetical protein V6C99_08130 [Oculatellaceae cyanobacterium]|jgi:hypothetical protein